MINFKNIARFKIFSSNGLITFISTIIGVFIGIFLTDYYNRQSLIKARDDAFIQVNKELENNAKMLIDYGDTLTVNFDRLKYLSANLNQEMEIVIHKDSLSSFQNKLTGILSVEKTDPFSKDSIYVRGEFNLNINSNLIVFDLQTVIWNTFKQTDYLSLTSFKCISNVEIVYNLFEDFNTANIKWRNNLLQGNFMRDRDAIIEFLKDFRKILLKHQLLMNMYDAKEAFLKDCS